MSSLFMSMNLAKQWLMCTKLMSSLLKFNKQKNMEWIPFPGGFLIPNILALEMNF